MKILVENLSSEVSPDFLQKIFQVYGTIATISLTVDNSISETVGEVEMPDANEASNAVFSLDGNRIEGQVITIKNKSEFLSGTAPDITPVDNSDSNYPPDKRKESNRRTVDSPLFKSDKGIVIDRRDDEDRRKSSDEDFPPTETTQ